MSPALTAPGQAAPPAAPAAPPAPLAQQPATGAISQPNESNPILGVQPKDKEGQIIPQPQAEARQAVRVEPAAQPATPLSWWLIEGGLVLIALATGISAVVLWRRYRA